MGSQAGTRSWDLRGLSRCSKQPKSQALGWGRGCAKVWGQIHLVQRDSRFTAVRGSCVCQNLQTHKVHVCKKLWRSRSWGLRFPWRMLFFFFFKFKTKFLKGFIFNRKYKILFIHSLADSYIQRQELLTQMWDEFHIICFSSNTGQSILAKKKSISF